MRGITLIFIAALAIGCASKPSVSEFQCRAGDWQTIGYRDGSNGSASTHLLAHQEACGAFGIVPKRTAYMQGWQDGLATYCTADNGFNLGQRGYALNTVCSGELRQPFASAYADGKTLYAARAEVRRLANTLHQREQRLEQIKQELVGATTAQLVPDLTVQERVSLLAKVESLAEERTHINAELPELEYALQEAEAHLARLDQLYAVR